MDEATAYNDNYLPLGYDDNKITLLSKDPHWLYAYWEISGEKRNKFIKEFRNELWEKSIPVIKISNVSKNTSFFVRINDFSNSWYINVPDANALYTAELGRKVADQFFINLISSNYVSTPANNIGKDTAAYFVDYNNLKNGKLDLETGTIYETYNSKFHSNFIVGISSPELLGIDFEKSYIGISSAEMSNINVFEHLGISSASFVI